MDKISKYHSVLLNTKAIGKNLHTMFKYTLAFWFVLSFFFFLFSLKLNIDHLVLVAK